MKGPALGFDIGIASAENLVHRLQRDERGFALLSQILENAAGIHMVANEKNLSLMSSRLASVLKKHGLEKYRDYVQLLTGESSEQYLQEFVSALTTNTTQFFRERVHFEILRTKFKELIEQKRKTHQYELQIWCAAASTGQEPYTIMMALAAQLQSLTNWDIRFLATDIDHEVLERAVKGIYQESEMRDVPELYRKQYFHRVPSSYQIAYQVHPEIRHRIRFAPFNLMEPKFPFQHPFDIIFCRNVLIYFDKATAEGVIDKLSCSLAPGGLLFLGHSETGMMRSKLLKTIGTGAYQRAVARFQP